MTPPSTTEALGRAIERLVLKKENLDNWLSRGGANELIERTPLSPWPQKLLTNACACSPPPPPGLRAGSYEWPDVSPSSKFCAGRYRGGIDPFEFAEVVIPFFRGTKFVASATDGCFLELPAAQVLGLPHETPPALVSAEERAETLKKFERQVDLAVRGDFSMSPGAASPSATGVGSLGLYLAHEGKHRPSLYRFENRNPRYRVDFRSYPAASQLALEFGPTGTVAVLNDESRVDLHPHFENELVGLFEAYGVQWRKRR